jgi:uncharacterized membrane protein YeaQ/YmgE (transglycosylase-associated protein family)
MLAVIADGITIRIGDHIWSFGPNVLLYIVVAAIVGAIAEAIVGWRVPFGIIGATIAGLIGIWLMTQVIEISGVSISVNGQNDVYLWDVPIIRALIGALIFVALWHLLTFGFRRRRSFRHATE